MFTTGGRVAHFLTGAWSTAAPEGEVGSVHGDIYRHPRNGSNRCWKAITCSPGRRRGEWASFVDQLGVAGVVPPALSG